MDHGSRIMGHGSRIMDQGSKIKDRGSRIKDLGPCFGMNEHPGRDTGVILRPSKSTIDFLPFYTGLGSLSRVKMIVLDENIAFV